MNALGRSLYRLRRQERGNVLYLTLVLLMILVLFTYVLVNITYLAVMKIKAQNIADQMALSAATLQARLLNRIENMNGFWFFGIRAGGFINEYIPYPDPLSMGLAAGAGWASLAQAEMDIGMSALKIDQQIYNLMEQHELPLDQVRIRVRPTRLKLTDFTTKKIGLKYLEPPEELPKDAWFCYEEMNVVKDKDIASQSRVEIRLKRALIGGESLDMSLPDVAARSRAQVVQTDAPVWGRYWKVKLVPPDEATDIDLRDH